MPRGPLLLPRARTRIPFIPVLLFNFVIKRRLLCMDTVLPGRVVEIGMPAGAVT